MKMTLDKLLETLSNFSIKVSIVIDTFIKNTDEMRILYSQTYSNKSVDDIHKTHKCLLDILESLALLKIVFERLINRVSRLNKLVNILKEDKKDG